MKYEVLKDKNGVRYFVKNHKIWCLDDFDIWGLDRTIWYDKIDYKFYKVNFEFDLENNKDYIILRKNKKTKELENRWR